MIALGPACPENWHRYKSGVKILQCSINECRGVEAPAALLEQRQTIDDPVVQGRESRTDKRCHLSIGLGRNNSGTLERRAHDEPEKRPRGTGCQEPEKRCAETWP